MFASVNLRRPFELPQNISKRLIYLSCISISQLPNDLSLSWIETCSQPQLYEHYWASCILLHTSNSYNWRIGNTLNFFLLIIWSRTRLLAKFKVTTKRAICIPKIYIANPGSFASKAFENSLFSL